MLFTYIEGQGYIKNANFQYGNMNSANNYRSSTLIHEHIAAKGMRKEVVFEVHTKLLQRHIIVFFSSC